MNINCHFIAINLCVYLYIGCHFFFLISVHCFKLCVFWIPMKYTLLLNYSRYKYFNLTSISEVPNYLFELKFFVVSYKGICHIFLTQCEPKYQVQMNIFLSISCMLNDDESKNVDYEIHYWVMKLTCDILKWNILKIFLGNVGPVFMSPPNIRYFHWKCKKLFNILSPK